MRKIPTTHTHPTNGQLWKTICGQLWLRQLFNARLGIFMNATTGGRQTETGDREETYKPRLSASDIYPKKRVKYKRATPKNRHWKHAMSPVSVLDIIIEWRRLLPPWIPLPGFKCFVSACLFLAHEKEKCRQGDVFMVNDLCHQRAQRQGN